jgi:hypothetical protein
MTSGCALFGGELGVGQYAGLHERGQVFELLYAIWGKSVRRGRRGCLLFG